MSPGHSSTVVAEVKHQAQGPILVTEMIGRAGLNVLMDHVRSHHDEWALYDRLIYDVRNWDVGSLTSDALRHLPDSFKSLIALRDNTWVAIVIAPHLEELAKVLVAIYEAEGLAVELTYFFDRAAAVSWLLEQKA